MASTIILSDNGASSGSAGLKQTAGNDGVLILQTTTSGGTATNAVTIDTSQNMGLGGTPSAWGSGRRVFQIAGPAHIVSSNSALEVGSNQYYDGAAYRYITTAASALYYQTGGAHVWYQAGSGTAGNAISFTQAMTLDASGNWYLGNTGALSGINPRAQISQASDVGAWRGLVLQSATDAILGIDYQTSTGAWQFSASYISSAGYKPIAFQTSGAERMRIDTSGNLLVGATSALPSASTARLNVQATTGVSSIYASSSSSFTNAVVQIGCGTNSGTAWSIIEGYSANGGADQFAVLRFRVIGNGNVVNTNNSYGAISDIKLKENISDATPKLEKLNQVRVVNYNFIGDEQKQIGVIAQELEQIFPGMVEETADTERVTTTDEDGNEVTNDVPTGTTTKSVKYSVFVPMLIKAIQELKAELDTAKEQIAILQGAQQ